MAYGGTTTYAVRRGARPPLPTTPAEIRKRMEEINRAIGFLNTIRSTASMLSGSTVNSFAEPGIAAVIERNRRDVTEMGTNAAMDIERLRNEQEALRVRLREIERPPATSGAASTRPGDSEWRVFDRRHPHGQGTYIIGLRDDAAREAQRLYGPNGAFVQWRPWSPEAERLFPAARRT